MLKQVAVSELTPGMMVTKVIEQSGRVKIRKVGFIRSADMIRGLKEMGVTLVEVDLDQSLNVELESDEDEANEAPASQDDSVRKITATQRLVASNKQIADVDRQLSQQFHRSLFLPAVDQMPSKWALYGKPYAVLLAYIVCGLLIGGVSSYTIMALSTSADVSVANNAIDSRISDAPKQSTGLANNQREVNKLSNQNASIPATLNENPQSQNEETESDTVNTAIQSKALDTDIANKAVNKTESIPAQNISTSERVEPSIEQALVNGVPLEEGQQVLGYQGSSDDIDESDSDNRNDNPPNNRPWNDSTRVASNSQSIDDNKVLNSDLYRRIQRVAQDVDDQPADLEPQLVKVTDLNDLPRIDQLPPALLTQMPAMSFSAHMYASNAQDRWVRVNSKRLAEGDTIANNVVLKRIESEKVVLEYKGTEFTMNALSDW